MAKRKKAQKKPLTIVKILGGAEKLTQENITKWRKIFDEKLMTAAEANTTGEVEVSFLPQTDDQTITVVHVGNEFYKPSAEDLDHWRLVFEEAMKDPSFTIFTHHLVNIEVVRLGDIVALE